MRTTIAYRLLDYTDAADAATLVGLLDAYARDPMGGGAPLDDRVREALAAALADTPNAFSIVGEAATADPAADPTADPAADPVEQADDAREAVGLANCFVSLSTFAARPLVNIHDLAVIEGWRGRGVGRGLLGAVEAEARRRGACKITLEVLEGNAPARIAYERYGFTEYRLDDAAGTALFRQKVLAPLP